MSRRTKIIATIGPASDDPAVIRRMIAAGADVFRIGLAHGSLGDAIERYRRIRAMAADGYPLRRQVVRLLGVLRDRPLPRVWQI